MVSARKIHHLPEVVLVAHVARHGADHEGGGWQLRRHDPVDEQDLLYRAHPPLAIGERALCDEFLREAAPDQPEGAP